MSASNEIYLWLISSLFILGVLLIPLGLCFLLLPKKMEQIGEKLNNWISTEHFFDNINKPIYQERLIYRNHKVFGILIVLITSICIYMMCFYTNISNITNALVLMADTAFGKWLLESLYYILIGANAIALFLGAVIFIRPSVLKTIEEKANRWVETEGKLKVLDQTKELPNTVLPGNPRVFGTLILVGAAYIIINTIHIVM